MTICEKKNLNQIAAAPDAGRNIVLSMADLSDYPILLTGILHAAQSASIPVVRFQFISDEDNGPAPSVMKPIAAGQEPDQIQTVPIRLNHRFRHFTVAVHREIAAREKGTLFLFDCLSGLQTAWATDLMMVNFFRVTTPLLSARGDTALFPLKAGMHSDTAARQISETADIFLNVCSDFKNVYVRAEKIRGEEDSDLFQPHMVDPETGAFRLLTDGVKLSRYHRAQDMTSRMHPDLSMDSWDRFFLNTQRKYEYGDDLTEECARMCRIMMSRDKRMRGLILENFRPEDYFFVKEHMVGSGQIGGKSCGMLTARKIIENRRPELYDYMEAHDSFYIGSDVFSGYLVENGLWELSVRQNTEEEYFILCNYFASIGNTDRNLELLTDYLREDDVPVILVLFGDHNPWMGNGGYLYDRLGISFDQNTLEGFLNYYATRYIIWANDSAKEVLGRDIVGTGPDISPCFLMNQVFELCGWDGPAYMQAIRPAAHTCPVVHETGRFLTDNTLTYELPEDKRLIIQNYKALEYYWRRNFAYKAFLD